MRSPAALPQTLLTVLVGELFGLLVRHVSLGLQVGLVSDQNDDLETSEAAGEPGPSLLTLEPLDRSRTPISSAYGQVRVRKWTLSVEVLTEVGEQRCVCPLTVLGLVRFLASVNQLLR